MTMAHDDNPFVAFVKTAMHHDWSHEQARIVNDLFCGGTLTHEEMCDIVHRLLPLLDVSDDETLNEQPEHFTKGIAFGWTFAHIIKQHADKLTDVGTKFVLEMNDLANDSSTGKDH